MKYSSRTKPGMADPYWYEWSVGQKYIIDMLNPDSHIQHVELQANVQLGLDDVIITYDNGTTRFIQVKHTRVDDTITFGDLVSADDSSKTSLLRTLAKAWYSEKKNHINSEVVLFTNRKVSERTSVSRNGKNIKRPALNEFLRELSKQVKNAHKFSDIVFLDNNNSWMEWCDQLNDIETDEDKLLFMKNFHIETGMDSLEELEIELKNKLQKLLMVPKEGSDILLGKLDHALRDWTTSHRKSSKITKEILYSALSIKEDVINFNHDLIPVNPFFESRRELVSIIEENLLVGKEKVVFLSGVPGTGKTNIISKLCGKMDSIIDIRYYAYEPIDPTKEYLPSDVSERVNKEVFWDTILNQLRDLLDGKLFKYKVPVLNSFLTLEKKRSEFFRIASEYAKDRDQVFILAVDGLDHAARSEFVEQTFLATLPNPEYIPSNVKIIIAGQPKEKYKKYPDWLYSKSLNLKEYTVPDIQKRDIEAIVNEECKDYDNSKKKVISDIIYRYAGGNTLAAIFAVNEALKTSDPIIFEEILQSRNLSGNIQEYYRTIWENAKKNMEIPFVDYKIAGVFAFFNEPVSAEKLTLIFKNERITCSDWRNILKVLSPLLREKDGSYTILHNDVRVYLASIINRDKDYVAEVYSNLVDYYLSQDKKTCAFYQDILRFLVSAGRIHEFLNVYTTDYLISAYVNGIELMELTHISDELLRQVIQEDPIDWGKLRSLALGYLTIEQIRRISYEIEDVSFRKSLKIIRVHKYECYIAPINKWNISMLDEVLTLVDDLFKNDEAKRAKTLFMNWFGNCSFSTIQKTVESDDKYKEFKIGDISKLLSKACINSDFFDIVNYTSLPKENRLLIETVKNIVLDVFAHSQPKQLEKVLKSIKFIPTDSLVCGITELIKDNRHRDLMMVKSILQTRKNNEPMAKMIMTFLEIITGDVKWDHIQAKLIWNEIKSVKMPSRYIAKNPVIYYSIYTVVLAYMENMERSAVAREVTNKYIVEQNSRKSKFFSVYFSAVAYIGKWFKAKSRMGDFLESKEDLKLVLRDLYCKKWNQNEKDYSSSELEAITLKTLIMLIEKESIEFQSEIRDTIEAIFVTNPVNQLLDPGMFYYRKNITRMQHWIDEWLEDSGKVWSEDIGSRYSIIKKFKEVKDRYDEEKCLNLRNAIERVKWSVIGFSSHKEYVIDQLLNWYSVLVERFPSNISNYGMVVKELSDIIDVLGDNRMEYILNNRIYSDWGSEGASRILNILQDKRLLSQCIISPTYLIEMLIGYLSDNITDKSELLTIWAIGIGLLDWRNDKDHDSISALQKAIEISASRNGIAGIKNDLSNLGPAYVDLSVDSLRYIVPCRWFNNEPSEKELDDEKNTLNSYIKSDGECLEGSEIVKVLKNLYSANMLEYVQIKQVLAIELEKSNSSFYNNSVIEWIFGIANESDIDECIRKYIRNALNDRFYPYQELPNMIGWRLKYKDEKYNIESLEAFIETIRCWTTASNHIKAPELECSFDYSKYSNFKQDNLFRSLMEILLLILTSDDAEAARVAVGGITALLRVNIDYISEIESYWHRLHFFAKEWILMAYELVYTLYPEYQDKIFSFLERHSTDEDFNVALYSKMLCENFEHEFNVRYSVEKKEYFPLIPQNSDKQILITQRNSQWINGRECVLEQISLLENRLQIDLSDIERRTKEYSDHIEQLDLVPLCKRRNGCYKVVCDKVHLAFYRVLYKDWYDGRWEGLEAELARVVLSASEPFILLVSPNRWKWNDGRIFDNIEKIVGLSEHEKLSELHKVLNRGINSDEIVLAGVVEDYTYKQQFFGFRMAYLDVPNYLEQYAIRIAERNSRIFLKKRMDYIEQLTPNVFIHQNGITIFNQSSIMCGFSKLLLSELGLNTKIGPERIEIYNSHNEIVAWLECYYGLRTDTLNNRASNQPYLQRWVVKKSLFEKLLRKSAFTFQVKTAEDSVIIELDK
jgi:hypothetical protein